MKTPFSLHILELRSRILYIIFSFCVTFFSGTIYSVPLTYLICTPFSSGLERGSFFIFTHVTEGFYAAIEVSFASALICCIPFLIYQAYSFYVPSCYKREQNTINLILFFITILFFVSLYFAALIILPEMCNFLQQFQYSSKCIEIKLEARIAPAVHWSCTAFLLIALFFQTPIFFVFLCKAGVAPSFLHKNRKYAFFFILMIASLFSPPDVYIQCLLAFIGCFFYESLFWFALLYEKIST